MSSNPLQLDVHNLPGELPSGVRICAAELAERADCASLLAAAQAEAERIKEEAEALLAQAQQDAQEIRLEAHRQAEEEIEQLRKQAHDAAAIEAVQWLCAEQDIEKVIARQVSQKWRHLTAQVLSEAMGKFDQSELVLRRVERKVIELLPHGQIALHVCSSAVEAAQRSFADTKQVVVLADDQLTEGQARLETQLLHIYLDQTALEQELLTQLGGDLWRQAHA